MSDESPLPGDADTPQSRRPSATQLGVVIRERRQDLGLSQAEVASHAGITTVAVSAIEGGHIKLPSPERLRAIAAILGLRHVDLLVAAGLLATDEVPGGTADDWNAFRYPHLHRAIDRMSPATAATLQDMLLLLADEPEVAAALRDAPRARRQTRKAARSR